MKISPDTEEVLKFLDYTTGGNLRKRNDLGIILETGAIFGEHELTNKLMLLGASVRNIHSQLRRIDTNTQGYDRLEHELRNTALELGELLKELCESADEETKERLGKIYLSGGNGSFKNIIDLSQDLAAFKAVQIKLRNRTKE